MIASELLEMVRVAGVELWVDGDRLKFRAKQFLPAELRERLSSQRDAIIEMLTGGNPHTEAAAPGPAETSPPSLPSPPDPATIDEIVRLVDRADRLPPGVSGTHPRIAAAAAVVASAVLTNDLPTVRFALGEFRVAVRAAIRQTRR